MVTLPILLTLGTVLVLFIAFIKQPAPAELLALCAVGFLLAAGVLKTNDFLQVFSNPAAMTVAAMFILSGALDKTGVIDVLGKFVLNIASKNNLLALAAIFLAVFTASFFVNNTSIVLIMIPVMIALAHNIALPASKLLIPLSYASILGGTCTIIGTSTNLLVDGVAQNMGIPAFSMFEMLVPGLCMAVVGGLYLLLFGKKLLPERKSLSDFFDQSFRRKYITQIHISENSEFVGKTIEEAGFTEEKGSQPIKIIKKAEGTKNGLYRFLDSREITRMFRDKIESRHFSSDMDPKTVLEAGDKLVLMTGQRDALTQADKAEGEKQAAEEGNKEKEKKQLINREDIVEDPAVTMEGIVAPGSSFARKFIRQLHLGEVYDVHIIAVHRPNGKVSADFDNLMLSVGDTLLLRGKESEIKRLFENDELLNLSKPHLEPYNYKKAPIAVAAIALVVLLAIFNVFPIAGSAFIAAVVVILTGCLKTKDAYKVLQAEVLLLIYAMLGISVAMEKTGALKLVVGGVTSGVEGLPVFVTISVLYLLTSLITEVFSNAAAAVMITPVAIGLAQQMGVDPRPFAVAVMFGASASFATPVGYQTNTLVFHAGGYRFSDYLRIGLPMNIILWLAASVIIPWYWGL